MKRAVENFLSVAFVLIGVVLILNSFSGMTGFVVSDTIGTVSSVLLGLVFFIGGIILLVYEGQQGRFQNSLTSIVGLYEAGKIDSMQAAERINELREGKQIKGVDYTGGKDIVINTKKGNFSIDVEKGQETALGLVAGLYWTSLINDRNNITNSDIKIEQGKMPKLDKAEGGLTGYLKDFSQKHIKDLQRLAGRRS